MSEKPGQMPMSDLESRCEREPATARQDIDRRVSVTLGLMQTIRELRERVGSAEAAMMNQHSVILERDQALAAANERAEKAEAAVDEMRAGLAAKDAALAQIAKINCTDEALNASMTMVATEAVATAALSPEAGKGWMSPEGVQKLRGENLTLQINLEGSKGMSRLMREQRDAWRDDAMRLSIWAKWYRSTRVKHGQLDEDIAAHDSLVAKDDPSLLAG